MGVDNNFEKDLKLLEDVYIGDGYAVIDRSSGVLKLTKTIDSEKYLITVKSPDSCNKTWRIFADPDYLSKYRFDDFYAMWKDEVVKNHNRWFWNTDVFEWKYI